MGWSTVPICDQHWFEEEGAREPVRLVESARNNERCYRCGYRADGIYVRRNVPDEAGRISAACTRCGKEVSGATTNEAAVIVLGSTYDDVAVCIVFHSECLKEAEKVYVPPRGSDGLSLIDAVMENEPITYPVGEPDRREDV